jgi:hypothetical protein
VQRPILFVSSSEEPSSISTTTVLSNTQSEYGVSFLSNSLLKKGLSSYTVSWFYDSRGFDEANGNPDTDIPSFRYAATKRFIKNKEFFGELNIVAPDNTNDGVVSFGIAEHMLNRLDATQVICTPTLITGSSVTSSMSNTILRNSELSLVADEVTISRELEINDLSLISDREAESNFLLSTLKNGTSINIQESVPSTESSVITQNYVNNYSDTLFQVDRKNLPINTEVQGLDDHSICSNYAFVEIVKLKAEEMYAKLLKIKITGKDNSTLGELKTIELSLVITAFHFIKSSSNSECKSLFNSCLSLL